MNPSRRSVLTAGVALGGGLLVRVGFAGEKTSFEPNAFIRVPSEGPIHIVLGHVEMGQGTLTGTAMLIAEELEVDPRSLVVDFAPAAHAYDDPQSGIQLTGGSSSTPSDWEPMRQAGASAREMLKEAAARRLGARRAVSGVRSTRRSHGRGGGGAASGTAEVGVEGGLPARLAVSGRLGPEAGAARS